MDQNSSNSHSDSEWFLYRLHHPQHKKVYIPKVGQLSIGTDISSTVCVNEAYYVHISKTHCTLKTVDGKPTIFDCLSTTGTFVNSKMMNKFHPGQHQLKVDDIVCLGHHNNEIQSFYKTNGNILRYRVCREVKREAIIISDGSESENETPSWANIQNNTNHHAPTVQMSVKLESDSFTGEQLIEDSMSPEPELAVFPSHAISREPLPVQSLSLDEYLAKSSFEEEYDIYVKTEINEKGYESDTEVCSPMNEVIILSDDEYNDQHYSQLLLDEIKQENVYSEEENVEVDGLATKLNPDADATRRYKSRAKDEEKSRKESKDQRDSTDRKSDRDDRKKHRSFSRDDQEKKEKKAKEKKNDHIGKGRSSSRTEDTRSHVLKPKNSVLSGTGTSGSSSEGDVTKGRSKTYKESISTSSKSSTRSSTDTEKRRSSLVESNLPTETTHPGKYIDKPLADPKKSPPKRRNSVADWNVIGAKRAGGTIEIEPPANRCLRSQPDRRYSVSEDDTLSRNSKPSEEHKESLYKATKPTLKRRGSVSTIEEAQSMIQKKIKRRYSVSDRSAFDIQPISAKSKDKKEERNIRLKELVSKQKQQESTTAPQTSKKSTGTVPKVKFTPNNRGSFLVAPVPPPPSRPTSRPVETLDSIVCTQSTSLDLLPDGSVDEVIDVRPKKMTFKSVEKVSNVNRPAPNGSRSIGALLPPRALLPPNALPPPKALLPPNALPPPRALLPPNALPPPKALLPPNALPPPKALLPPRSDVQPKIASGSSGSIGSSGSSGSIGSSGSSSSFGSVGPTGSLDSFSSTLPLPNVRKSQQTHQLKGILKLPGVSTNRGPGARHIKIREDWNEVVVFERYIDCTETGVTVTIQELVNEEEMELISEVLEWDPNWLRKGGSELTGKSPDGPFASHGKMLQSVESYADYESFQKIIMPFLKRELWNDVNMSKASPVPCVIHDVICQTMEHHNLCQIVCKAYLNRQLNDLTSSEIGILEYQSERNETRSLFAYVHNQYRGSDTARQQGQPGPSGQLMFYTFYAARREMEGLRNGRYHRYRPLTRIHLHLRRCNAVSTLKHSPLLQNILSPTYNIEKLSAIGSASGPRLAEKRKNLAKRLAHTLNPIQLDVVASVLDECSYWEEPTISIIQGPPGTGKSRVISHLVRELMNNLPRQKDSRMKVLVCASSNTAVDVIVKNLIRLQQKAAAEIDRFKVVRTGTRAKVDPECMQVFIDKLVQDEINRENQQAAMSIDASLISTYQNQIDVLDRRIKMAVEEVSRGNNVMVEKLNEMRRKRENLAELLKPGSGTLSFAERKIQERTVRSRLLDDADIVCTTLGSCVALALYCNNIQFDVCLIDEATQCTEICTLLPLQYNISKLVLVGDINQLPATVLDQQSIMAGFKMSLFSRICQSYQDNALNVEMKMLKVQYRMHPEICLWPNTYFYRKKLQNAPSIVRKSNDTRLKPYMVVSLSYDQELTQAEHEIYNRDEIMFVVGLMKEVVQCFRKHTSFAIITPYARHKEELIPSLVSSGLPQVEVHSIDSVQGKEYDVVIISLARSNGAGFLNNPERINVAMTRARQCLVLCGNFASLRHKPVWSSLLEDAERREVLYHLEDHDPTQESEQMVRHVMRKLRVRS